MDIPASPQVKRLSRKDITLTKFVKEKIESFDRVRKTDLHTPETPRRHSKQLSSRRQEREKNAEGEKYDEEIEEEKDDGGDDFVSKREKVIGRFQTKDRHCSRFVYNLLCYVPYIDDEVLNQSSTRTPLAWSALLWVAVYRVAFFAIWVWLQIITGILPPFFSLQLKN